MTFTNWQDLGFCVDDTVPGDHAEMAEKVAAGPVRRRWKRSRSPKSGSEPSKKKVGCYEAARKAMLTFFFSCAG